MKQKKNRRIRGTFVAAAALAMASGVATGGEPDFPPFDKVSEGYELVDSTADDSPTLFRLYKRDKDNQLLAALPRNYESQKYFVAVTIAAGARWAGLQGGDTYVYWKRFDDRLALVQPNLAYRSSGDRESKAAAEMTFTDRVVLEVPIVAMGPTGGPVIDLDAMLLGNASTFFGTQARGLNPRLASVSKAKAFPGNVEIALEAPVAGGTLRTFHYSISSLPENTGYKPREADQRVGYFTTSYIDLGKYSNESKYKRYINRWKIEKADPSLKLSPPKEPIVFYIDHTVPVRYRRFVRNGIEYWNEAFENIGISNALEVRQQDARTGAHMDKDPEDNRYNFIRWVSNDVTTAIGPSRVHPMTGQILDADVVLTDGWIRVFEYQFRDQFPKIATDGFTPETLQWLARNPRWSPEVRFAAPGERAEVAREIARRAMEPLGGHPLAQDSEALLIDEPGPEGTGRFTPMHINCRCAEAKGMELAILANSLRVESIMERDDDGDGEPDVPQGDIIDGVPENFIGVLLQDLVAHEVGHTLGLRHNFKASAIYTLDEINSDEIKGKKPLASSVMDYLPTNIALPDGPQGDYGMISVGPYDMWAIEYGYTLDDPQKVFERMDDPQLRYLTDEDTIGPDPLARRYDFTADPIDFAQNQIELAEYHRERLLEEFVKDGESWARARDGYAMTLSMQLRASSMMANWIGGAHVNRTLKGDALDAPPIEVVDADVQREALRFVVDHTFYDDAYGLTPEILKHLTVDKWFGGTGRFSDPSWEIHDNILGFQSAALTQLMNPTTLRRVYDNEFRVDPSEDALTLAELLQTVKDAAWEEVADRPGRSYSEREPMISSLRRNLQREHVERLIDLTKPDTFFGAARKPVSNLALYQLRSLAEEIDELVEGHGSRLDAYTMAHLSEVSHRIEQSLDAEVIYNTDDFGGMNGFGFMFFGDEGEGHGGR